MYINNVFNLAWYTVKNACLIKINVFKNVAMYGQMKGEMNGVMDGAMHVR